MSCWPLLVFPSFDLFLTFYCVSVLYLRLLIATLVFSSFSFCLADYELNQLNGNKKKYNNDIHYKLIEELGQKLPTFPVHLISAPGFSGVRTSRSLVFIVVFYISLFVLPSFVCWPLYCLSFRPLSFGCCIVCPSIYGFWLSLRYLYIQFDDAVGFSDV